MSKMNKELRVFLYLILLFMIQVLGYSQPESDYADFACLSPLSGGEFYKGPSNAVCKIYWTENGQNYDATGVLVNNTNKDGKYLVLTAAHNLPEDSNGNPQSESVINTALSSYLFEFFYERNSCNQTIPAPSGMSLVGAKVLGVYSEGSRFNISGQDYQLNSDIALLELSEKPDLTYNKKARNLYFAGWNAQNNGGLPSTVETTDQVLLDAGLMISHTHGYPKKVTIPKRAKRRKIDWVWDQEQTTYYAEVDPTAQSPDKKHWIQDNNTDFHNYLGYTGVTGPGSSGAPIYNQEGLIYAIKQAGIPIASVNHTVSSSLNGIWSGSYNGYSPINNFLDPTGTGITELEGCYPCQMGTTAVTTEDQNRYRRNQVVDSEIPANSSSQSYIAQDQIELKTIVREGNKMGLHAKQVLLTHGAEIKAGAEVEITSGGMNGLSCATGCYGIESAGYEIIDGNVYADVINADQVEVHYDWGAPGSGSGQMEIKGAPVFLFNIVESGITSPGYYDFDATYTNDCDQLVVSYEYIQITQADINASETAYDDYAASLLSVSAASYLADKASIASDYLPTTSYNPSGLSNIPEDVSFQVEVEENVPYATAHGSPWSFQSSASYRAEPAIMTMEFEVEEGLDLTLGGALPQNQGKGPVQEGTLYMDVYYPKPGSGLFDDKDDLPLIIYMFGGGFLKRDYPELDEETCRWLASKGYVVAAIEYRLGMDPFEAGLAKRAPLRAWQDLEAAVKYWRNRNYQGGKWKIDPNKIYGLGWSAGAITVLQNIYLTRSKYNTERGSTGYLNSTTGNYQLTAVCHDFNGDGSCDIESTVSTYDLEAYPTIPCIGIGGDPCDLSQSELNLVAATDGRLNKGASFAGGMGKKEWMSGADRPATDIHHINDKIVPIDTRPPFTYFTSFVNSILNYIGVSNESILADIDGGETLESYANSNSLFGYSLLELDDKYAAGGEGMLSVYHLPQLRYGTTRSKSKENPELEEKVMFYVDAFFLKDHGGSSRVAGVEANQDSLITALPMLIYPNPTNGRDTKMRINTKRSGELDIIIIDLQGKTVGAQKVEVAKGVSEIILNIKGLSKGLYTVKVSGAGLNQNQKLLVSDN
jgi:hypothetical protein